VRSTSTTNEPISLFAGSAQRYVREIIASNRARAADCNFATVIGTSIVEVNNVVRTGGAVCRDHAEIS
jgi:hypothetical protein